MKKIVTIGLIIVLAAILISGLIPTQHYIQSCSCDWSFEKNDKVCTDWSQKHYFYSPGWLVKLFIHQ
jgi:hypothetical protein